MNRPTHTPAWAKGMRKLAPGVYLLTRGCGTCPLCLMPAFQQVSSLATRPFSLLLTGSW